MNSSQKKRNFAVLFLLVFLSCLLFGVAFLRVNGGSAPVPKKTAFLGFKNLFSATDK